MVRSVRSPEGTGDADRALLARLTAFLAAEKVLTAPIAWTDTNGDLRFTASLDIDGVTEEGLLLFGRAIAALPDREVILGLRWTRGPARFDHFDRFNWRPMDAHNNKGLGPADLRFRLFDGTHRHPLALNAALDMGLSQAMADNLPVAVPVLPEPAGWEAFLAIAAEQWRIHDLVHTPHPPWQYGLLPLTGGEGRGGRKRGRDT
jgi:hypothetical protein